MERTLVDEFKVGSRKRHVDRSLSVVCFLFKTH